MSWREVSTRGGQCQADDAERKRKRPLPDRGAAAKGDRRGERSARAAGFRRALVVEGPQHQSGRRCDQQDLAGPVVAIVALAVTRRRQPVVAVVDHPVIGVVAAVEPIATAPVMMASAVVVPAAAAVAVTTVVVAAAITIAIAIVAVVPVARMVVARRV